MVEDRVRGWRWKIECADGVMFFATSRDDAESRFWDAIRRSSLNGVWKLIRPDGEAFITVTCVALDRVNRSLKEASGRSGHGVMLDSGHLPRKGI